MNCKYQQNRLKATQCMCDENSHELAYWNNQTWRSQPCLQKFGGCSSGWPAQSQMQQLVCHIPVKTKRLYMKLKQVTWDYTIIVHVRWETTLQFTVTWASWGGRRYSSPQPGTWGISSRLWEHRGAEGWDRRCDSCHRSRRIIAGGPQRFHCHTPDTCSGPPDETEHLWGCIVYKIDPCLNHVTKSSWPINLVHRETFTLFTGGLIILSNTVSSYSVVSLWSMGSFFTSVTAILTERQGRRLIGGFRSPQ